MEKALSRMLGTLLKATKYPKFTYFATYVTIWSADDAFMYSKNNFLDEGRGSHVQGYCNEVKHLTAACLTDDVFTADDTDTYSNHCFKKCRFMCVSQCTPIDLLVFFRFPLQKSLIAFIYSHLFSCRCDECRSEGFESV